jgi:hypothetical protein
MQALQAWSDLNLLGYEPVLLLGSVCPTAASPYSLARYAGVVHNRLELTASPISWLAWPPPH